MKLYRICPQRYLEDYSGVGASYRDGARWNRPGLPVMYFATTPSLAMLEMANYLPSPRLVPKSYRLGVYRVTKGAVVDKWSVAELPAGWNSYPYPASTQALGTEWLMERRAALLLVPSAAVPGGLEDIALFNPLYAGAGELLRLVGSQVELFNDRVFAG